MKISSFFCTYLPKNLKIGDAMTQSLRICCLKSQDTRRFSHSEFISESDIQWRAPFRPARDIPSEQGSFADGYPWRSRLPGVAFVPHLPRAVIYRPFRPKNNNKMILHTNNESPSI